jgi:hypothetical protein
MIALIDFDNLPVGARTRGLPYVAERVFQSATRFHTSSGSRVLCRLYGGWYSRGGPTRQAQLLAAEVIKEFPRTLPSSSGALIVDMELAYALAAEPSRHLLRTYRREGRVKGIGCRAPSAAGCTKALCPLASMASFVQSGTCPEPACPVKPEDFLFRRQQKLVDTMFTADMIHLAQVDSRILCVVSSDDDLWPGIKMVLLQKRPLIHLHTLPSHTTPLAYASGAGKDYVQGSF